MMKKNIYILTILLMCSCSKESKTNSTNADSTKYKQSVKDDVLKTQPIISEKERYKNLNDDLLKYLKEKDFVKFSNYIHPEKGISFSMYSFVNPKKDKHFSRADFENYLAKNTKFTWGEQDGTGDLLILSIKDYFNEWVFRRNYKAADFYLNKFKGTGNSINNIREIYPNAIITENYIPGTEIYSGMDWSSLIFVFEEYNGKYYIVAVANNSWTT